MTKRKAMEWVKALRSGKYKQGKHYLKYNNEYCCLGVLADISGVMIDPIDRDLWKAMFECGISSSLGIIRNPPYVNGYTSLSKANDAGTSFNTIADWIEVNYKNL